MVQQLAEEPVFWKQEGWKEVAPEKPGSSEARPVQGPPGGDGEHPGGALAERHGAAAG